MPWQVIVRPRGIARAPVRHGAFRVVGQGLLEALDRFAMVETKQPIEPAVEPELGVGRRRGDFSAVGSKIEISHGFLPMLHSSCGVPAPATFAGLARVQDARALPKLDPADLGSVTALGQLLVASPSDPNGVRLAKRSAAVLPIDPYKFAGPFCQFCSTPPLTAPSARLAFAGVGVDRCASARP